MLPDFACNIQQLLTSILLKSWENRSFQGEEKWTDLFKFAQYQKLNLAKIPKLKGRIDLRDNLNPSISTGNHMFGRAIWDKLPKCVFENFEIARVKRGQFQNFQKSRGWFIPKTAQTKRDYWLITSNQQTLCIETHII